MRDSPSNPWRANRHSRPLSGRPVDWPGPGPIDLDVHDRPHGSATTEWWYLNSHLVGDDGASYSLFASFFRRDFAEPGAAPRYAHSVAWALMDVAGRRYRMDSLLDATAPEAGLRR